MASKEGATEHGSGVGHTEYKASALKITVTRTIIQPLEGSPRHVLLHTPSRLRVKR